MLPGLREFLFQELVELLVLLAEVRGDNLPGQGHGLIFRDEELSVGSTFFCDSLCGEVLDDIGGELVNWLAIVIVEVAGEDSVVGILPLALILIIANKPVETSWESLKIWLGLLETGALHQRVWTSVLLPDLHMLLCLLVLRVGLTVGAAVIASLEQLWREFLLLLFVDNNQLINRERAIDIFKLSKHRVSLLGHQLQVHLHLSSLCIFECTHEGSQYE